MTDPEGDPAHGATHPASAQGLPPRGRRLRLPDERAAAALARRIALALPRGALLVLTGPLGAGKTTFVKGLAQALGSEATVTSPTYALVHEYPTPEGTLVHVDAYRLPDADALLALGLDELRERARLTVVEWGEVLVGREADAYQLALDRAGAEDAPVDARVDATPGDAGRDGSGDDDANGASLHGANGASLHGATWLGQPGR